MIFFFLTRIISATVAFLYPGYASYKTLSQRPASEADLERWLMYWSVLGCIVGVEYVAEWLVSWLPFYYTIKTLFLLYLSLPQTKGSSYLYHAHLEPFFHTYEHDIDATIAKLRSRLYTFVQERARMVWEYILEAFGRAVAAESQTQAGGPAASNSSAAAAAPTLGDPVSGPAQLMTSFWRNYGPSIIAGGAQLLKQTAQSAQGAARPFAARPAPPAPTTRNDQESPAVAALAERRRQLEAELASLPPVPESQNTSPGSVTSIPVQVGSSSYLPSSPGSDTDLRARVAQYEEVEVPSDVEGYDLGTEPTKAASTSASQPTRPTARKTGSWFPWAGAPVTPGAKAPSSSSGDEEKSKRD